MAVAQGKKTPWFDQDCVEWLERLHNRPLNVNEFRSGMSHDLMAKADEIVRSGKQTREPLSRGYAPDDSKWEEAASRYAAAQKRRHGKGSSNRTGYGNRSAKLASTDATVASEDNASVASSWESAVVETGEMGGDDLLTDLFDLDG